MVLVPAGSFRMGRNDPGTDHAPEHAVWLDEFWIDRTEVSNAAYDRYVKEAGGTPREQYSSLSTEIGLPDHPAVGISWASATGYAAWARKRRLYVQPRP